MTDSVPPPEPPSLERVLTEAKDALAKLDSEIEALDAKAAQQIQTNLIVLGIVFAAAGGSLAKTWNVVSVLIAVVAALLLAASTILTAWARLRGQFSSGTIFPYILKTRINDPGEDISKDLLDVVSSSHYYNYLWLLWKARLVATSGIIQIAGMLLLVAIVVAESLRAVH